MAAIVSTTTETDYLGSYVRYVYDNGHVETDPAGRPVFREDAQRLAGAEAKRKLAPMAEHFESVASIAKTARALPSDVTAAIKTADIGVYDA